MITVLRINKQGNKIINYTCTDGNQTVNLTKEQLCSYIDKKMVTNAKIQLYQGNTIVRVSDATKDIQKLPNKLNQTTQTKSRKSAYTILDYIDNAKNAGVTQLSLSDIIVNTQTLAIKKVKSVKDNTTTNASMNNVEYTHGIDNTQYKDISTEKNKGTYTKDELKAIWDRSDKLSKVIGAYLKKNGIGKISREAVLKSEITNIKNYEQLYKEYSNDIDFFSDDFNFDMFIYFDDNNEEYHMDDSYINILYYRNHFTVQCLGESFENDMSYIAKEITVSGTYEQVYNHLISALISNTGL